VNAKEVMHASDVWPRSGTGLWLCGSVSGSIFVTVASPHQGRQQITVGGAMSMGHLH